jgi:hypothetical protein
MCNFLQYYLLFHTNFVRDLWAQFGILTAVDVQMTVFGV